MLADPERWKRAARAGRRLAADAEGAVGAAAAATTCWSRRFRAATASTWSAYPFEGRLAHQTLGMLLTRRLERAGARPIGFVATDYSLAVWALGDWAAMFKRGKPTLAELFDEDMLGDDLEAWMAES